MSIRQGALRGGCSRPPQRVAPAHRRLFVQRWPPVALSSALLKSVIILFALVDAWVWLYQAICFRVCAVPQAPRGRYMIFDRNGLA